MKRRDFSKERSRRFFCFWKGEGEDMPKYYMKGTPFWQLERMMMRAPGNIHCEMEDKEKMKAYECGNCDYYIQNQPCTMVECKCLPERLEEGDLTLDRLARTLYKSNPAVLKRLEGLQLNRPITFFLNEEHRRRWKRWRDRFYKMPIRSKAAMYLLTAYDRVWESVIWSMTEKGFDYSTVKAGSMTTEEYTVFQAARAIEENSRNILVGDLASADLVSDDAFILITGALLLAIFEERILKGGWWS